MKAPTADYSPLSQALSAKSSAIQSGYAAKDASNWKSRYEIQEKSFDLQKEAISDAKAQNNWNLAINLADTYLNYKVQKDNLDKDNENLKVNRGWNEFGQRIDEISAKYGDNIYTEGTSVEYGADGRKESKYIQVNPEMMSEMNSAFTEIFGDESQWSKEAWDSIQSSRAVANSAIRQNMWQNYNARLSTQNSNMMNLQASDIMTSSVQNLDAPMVSVSYSDGKGGTTSVQIPAELNNLINNMASLNDAEKLTAKIGYSQQFQTARGNYLLSEAADMISSGRFMQDTSMVETMMGDLKEHEDSIKDKDEKRLFHANAQTAVTQGISGFVNNQLQQIADNGNDYNMVDVFKKEFDQGGQFYGFFFGENGKNNCEYLSEGTYSTITSGITTVYETLKTQYGTVATAEIQRAMTALKNDKFRTPNSFTTQTDIIMSQHYGDGWRQDPEAVSVLFENLNDLMPKDQDWTKHDGFKKALQSAWDTVFETGFTLADESTTSDKYKAAVAVQDSMVQRIYKAIIDDPGMLKDPAELAQTMDDISKEFTDEFFDAITKNLNENKAPKESENWLFDNVGQGYMFNELKLDENGYISSDSLFVSGMYSQYSTALNNVARGINMDPGMNVSTRSGRIQFKDGKTYAVFDEIGEDGNGTGKIVRKDLGSGITTKEVITSSPIAETSTSETGQQTVGQSTNTFIPPETNDPLNAEAAKKMQEGYTVSARAKEILDMKVTPLEKLDECPNLEVLNEVYGTLYDSTNSDTTKKYLKRNYEVLKKELMYQENSPKTGPTSDKFSSIENSEAQNLLRDNPNTPYSGVVDLASQATTVEAFDSIIDYYKEQGFVVSENNKQDVSEAREYVKQKSSDYYSMPKYGTRQDYKPPETKMISGYTKPVTEWKSSELTNALGKRNETLIKELLNMDPDKRADALKEIRSNSKYSKDEEVLFEELIARLNKKNN